MIFCSIMIGLRGPYFAIGSLGLAVAADEVTITIEYVGRASGKSMPLFPKRNYSEEHIGSDVAAVYEPEKEKKEELKKEEEELKKDEEEEQKKEEEEAYATAMPEHNFDE